MSKITLSSYQNVQENTVKILYCELTSDVVNLYTNIPYTFGLEALDS